jgi:UrcA family protein
MYRSTVGAVVAALVLITPNLARASEDQQEVVVRVGDLDTTTERGADRALLRIRRAARDVCDVSPGRRSLEDRLSARACVQDAMARAVADLGDPMVAARFNGAPRYARIGEQS